MAGYTPKLVDTEFQHWIKANLALNITKDGITDVVSDHMSTVHQYILNDIQTKEQIKINDFCTQCALQNILPCSTKGICVIRAGVCSFHQSAHYRPCPKRICDRLKDKIRKCHRFNMPSWKNTLSERWCQNPWELAKCYFPPDGYTAVNTIEETDLNGILSLLLNHTAFKNIVDEPSCEETREIGRRIRHSPNLCIDEKDMNSYLDTIVKFLSNSSLFQSDSKATDSVQKLKQLKADSLTIASDDVTKVLQDVIQENTRGSVEKINETAAQRAGEFKADLDKLEGVRSTNLKDILNAKAAAIFDIEKNKDVIISEIDNRKHAGISEIDNSKDGAIYEIDKSKDAGISEIDKNKDGAISEIYKNKDANISEIDKNKNAAISEIGNCKDHAISEIDNKIHTGVEYIKLARKKLKIEARSVIKQLGKPKPSGKEMEQAPAITADAEYRQLKNEFKEDLLAFNRENHSKISISPLLEETDTDIVGFYVPPSLRCIELQKRTLRGPCSEVRQPISDLKDVFYKTSKRCSNVFLTSEAGQGKTAFCKYLTLIWCDTRQSNKERQCITATDLRALQEFDFLFLISLRDASSTDCDIDDMIQNQIVQYLSRTFKYKENFVQELLHRERHLVILDGLDEWTHPEITTKTCRKKREYLPHRKARDKCAILTTTRSWKLSIANLKSSQIDNHIEIGSLDEEAWKQMIKNTITKICLRQNQNTDDDISQNIKAISHEIRSKSIPEFEVNPLILTYLICLWVEGKSLGRSKCEVYANILEMLLFRLNEKHPTVKNNDPNLQTCGNQKLPVCFETRGHIKSFYSSLLPLGLLAFEALFNKKMERSLVFDSSVAKDILTEKSLSFCLSTGLLVQSKVPGQLTARDTRISFSHKTFQEFFAALYIQSESDPSGVIQQVLLKCHNVEKILEMSNVLIFLSGLSPERASIISKKFFDVINEDNMTTSYRQNQHFYTSVSKPFQDLQNMYIACIKECHENSKDTNLNLKLSDVIIDRIKGDNEIYFCNLQTLILMNINNIRSVLIGHRTSERNTHDIITRFHLREIQTLEMFCLSCPIMTDDLERFFAASAHTLKQFYVTGQIWHGNQCTPAYNVLSDASVKSITNLQHLASLALYHSKRPHSQLELLISYLTERTSMKDIFLCDINCSDHHQSCNGFSMDLSQHSQLECVGLGRIPLSHLQMNTSKLEMCMVGELQNSNVVSSFLNSLSRACNLQSIVMMELESVLDFALDTIPLLIRLQSIDIYDTDMTDKKLKLSREMVGIEYIELEHVTMSCASFEQLVRDVEMLQQSIQVALYNCTVTPTDEYEKIKNNIKLSDRFAVYEDGKLDEEWREKPEEAKQEEVKVYGDLDTSTEPEIPDEVCPSIPVSLLSTEGGGKDNGVVDDGNDKEGKDNDVTDKEVQDDCDDDAGSGLYQMPFTATPVDDNRPPDYCNVGDFNFKRGSDCIRHTANAAGLQFPERITTTKLRKYLATVSQIFNLSTTEMTELARHMGHELSVHKKFYRLQDDVIELAKVSRLLIAVEEGKAAKFAGCSLDDINVSDIPEEEAVDEPDDDDEKDDEDMLFSYDVDETCCDTRSAAFNNMRHHEDMEVCDNTLHGGDNQFQDEDMDNNRHTNKEKSTGNISDGSTYDISSMEENRPVKEPKKDKCQRKIWTVEEKNALTELVTKSYDDRKPPRKSEILKCQIHYPVLKGINWLNIKYQVWALSQKKCAAKKKVIQELGLN